MFDCGKAVERDSLIRYISGCGAVWYAIVQFPNEVKIQINKIPL